MSTEIIAFIAWFIISGAFLYFFMQKKIKLLSKEKNDIFNEEKKNLNKEKNILEEDKKKLEEIKTNIDLRSQKIDKMEEKILEKEDKLDKKSDEIEIKQKNLNKQIEEFDKSKQDLEKKRNELSTKLSSIAKLTQEEAKELIIKQTEELYEKDFLNFIEKKKNELKLKEKEISKEIIIKSIQQYAGEVISENTQTTIHLEDDNIKWKVIWKEWRNIIAFERATWVSLIIDDTPDTVFISSFDLFRRYIAKKSLEQLIEDKRIQPARIEEVVEQNQRDAEKLIFDLWEKTINEMWITWIPEEIISLLWKLRFRTSYGQNILTHSKEVAYIAEMIAKEIWADHNLALKWWLLHDIGKAMDHDIEWTHPEIWARIAKKHWFSPNLINIIEWHHDNVPCTCIETMIIQIADTISAVRPWARKTSVEQYIKRIQEMENLVSEFKWVNKAYALSAWREVRIFVDSDTISDLEAEKLAREIAVSIEQNLNYPWEVKVNLIREKRIIEYAR